jgi:hypothetical protein
MNTLSAFDLNQLIHQKIPVPLDTVIHHLMLYNLCLIINTKNNLQMEDPFMHSEVTALKCMFETSH